MIISLVFHSYSPKDDLTGYVIRGATVSEVEIDVLTGEKLVGEELESGNQENKIFIRQRIIMKYL